MSWNEVEDNSNSSSKVEFTKFPEGLTYIRALDDQPHARWTHWIPFARRSANCPGQNVCPICKIRAQQKANGEDYTYSMQKKFAMNIINRDTGRLEIMEQGKTFFQDMLILHKEEGSVTTYDIKVRRRGTGQSDTSYRLDAMDKEPLSAEDEKIAQAKIDLNEYFKPHEPEKLIRILNGEPWNEVMGEGGA